jgi:lipopolysaccharide transport system permease protein
VQIFGTTNAEYKKPDKASQLHGSKGQILGTWYDFLVSLTTPKQALQLGLTLGWNDIRQTYKRSKLGLFWITLGMSVNVAAIGLVFGLIFGSPLDVFLPFLATGLIIWGLYSSILNEGAQAFVSAEAFIKQLPIPKITFLVRVAWRNLLVFAHNIIILPVTLVVVGAELGWSILVFPVGLGLAILSISGLALILAVAGARYRDVPPMVVSVVGVAFYATPVIWMPTSLGNTELAHLLLGLNPLYHLLQITRLPLLGQWPTMENWYLSALSAGVTWLLGIWIFRRNEKRIAYWV